MTPPKAFYLLCIFAVAGASANALKFALKPLRSEQIKSFQRSLDKSVLPDGALNVRLEARRSFYVQVGGRTELTLIPILFSNSESRLVSDMKGDLNACGIYLVDAAGQSRFEGVADSELGGLIQCGGVAEIGLAPAINSRPEVILIFNAHTNKRSWSAPYLVSWSPNDGRYTIETLTAPAGATPTEPLTLNEVLKWFAAQKPRIRRAIK